MAESAAAKAAFVAGLNGTSAWEVQRVVSLGIAAHVAWKVTQRALAGDAISTATRAAIDAALIVLPLVLGFTVVWVVPLLAALCLVYAAAMWAALEWAGLDRAARTRPTVGGAALAPNDRALLVALASPRKPFFDVYRALVMLSTCVCILAVDFPVFPRRFAKTETFGTSLMDVGVGSFVLVNSFSAADAIDRPDKSLWHTLRATLPLVALGLARLASVKAVDYHEHVSEYGVHWNFFFTLAALPLLVAAARLVVHRAGDMVYVGAAAAVAYQFALSTTPLQTYILDAPRADLLSMNKEGVFSVLGYFAIFACGISLGAYMLRRKRPGEWRTTVATLMALDALLWLLWLYLESALGLRTSRRLANLPYVVWTLAYNLPFLAAFLATDLLLGYTEPGVLYTAVNRNQLAIFLLANVLTGAVNMTIDTLNTPDAAALLILVGYMGVVCAAAVAAHSLNLRLKFW